MSYELLLINISRDHSGFSESFRDSIGQYAIASYLRQKEFKAYVFSGEVSDCKQVIQRELEEKRTNIVGFYAAADNIRVVGNCIKWIKNTYPECKTIIGGPQAAGLDYSFFSKTNNDYAIIGEGEIPMYQLLSVLVDDIGDINKVPSLVRCDSREKSLLVNSVSNAVIEDLDSIGFPIVEDSLSGRLRQGEIVGIITGRGCPYHCSFCYEGANAKNVRYRSISNVMEEIDYISAHNKKMNFISIYDDTFTLNKNRILEFCYEMKKRNLLWFCEGHISFVINQKDTLEMMIESGLACIQFGIESGADEVLEAYNKHTNYQMILKAVEICKELGIHSITGNFIIGGAHETYQTIEKSKKLAKELIHKAKGIIELYTVYFAPYPNTKMVQDPESFDISINREIQDMNMNTMRTPVVRTKELSRNEIYDIKHEFDEFIKHEYECAAKESTKSDILQGLTREGKRLSLNPTWEKVYLSQPHILAFLDHITEKEQEFNPQYYILRTFEDIKFDNGKLVSDVGEFEGLEKDILSFATGIYTAEELTRIFNVSIDEVEQIYYNLNERCLVYMSEF